MLAYLAMRLGMGILSLLPLRAAVALGTVIGRLAARFGTGRTRMVARHAARLDVPPTEVDDHVAAVYAAYGRYWAEALWVRPRRRRHVEGLTTHEGLDQVEAARDAGTGMIFALPHMGNWEYAAPVASVLEVEVVAVAENLPNRRIRDWFVAMRGSMDIGIVLATGAAQVMRDLEAVIARNGAVALLCDRDLRRRGVEVEFFGETTTLPAGPASLAIRTGAPLFPVATYFTDNGHHVVVRPPIELPDSGDRATRIKETTQRLARELEKLILAAPEQWHLLQPNWPSDHETT